MAESAVSFVLHQLTMLLKEERQLLGGLGREVEYIRDEMAQMGELLEVADAKEDNNIGLKEWIRQLQEISCDVEDVLDKYMLRFGQRHAANGFSGCIKKAYACIKNMKARHQIASEIQAIKYRLDYVSTIQKKYREMYADLIQGSSSTIPSNNELHGLRGEALYLEDAELVGIEGPKNKILQWIWSKGDGLEVISVVGMGGLGKTTLVKKVYDDKSVKKYFKRHVWIVVSDYKDVKDMLASLIKKLVGEIKEPPPPELEGMSVDDMRNFIFEFLQNDKYIIVLDDIWDILTWENLKFALPKGNAHGCIIITTRSLSIANASCWETEHVFNLKPLQAAEARELFYKKAFAKEPCPHNYLKELAENILMRCEGLPLAIVVIGGLLATKNNEVEGWEKLSKRISHRLDEDSSQLKRLWRLLSLSYNDLPYHLKYCFLYLSISPEGGFLYIRKLIRLWTYTGFVLSKPDMTMEEVANEYLNELLGRNLIQAVHRYPDGEVISIRVHDLVREYIISKSRKHNMVTVSNGGEVHWPNKIRHIAIQKFIKFPIETNNFKYLRSLILQCSANEVECGLIKDIISRCRLLKMLDLEGASLETIPQEVFKLHHLKCLCLRGTKVKVIPRSIKYLENLETLDVCNGDVSELPSEILSLRKLRHVNVRHEGDLTTFQRLRGVKYPCGIGTHLLSLQTLLAVNADEVDGVRMVREIGKLTLLRILSIAKLRSEDGQELCSSIPKLNNLRWLRISSFEGHKLELDHSLISSLSLPFLKSLRLEGFLERIPQWVPSLNCLTILCLRWSGLKEDPLNCLKEMPNLTYLEIHDAYVEGLCFKDHGFQKLKTLSLLELKYLKWVIVEKGSMPILQKLTMKDCKMLMELPRGIEHLTNLETLEFQDMEKEFEERISDEKKKRR